MKGGIGDVHFWLARCFTFTWSSLPDCLMEEGSSSAASHRIVIILLYSTQLRRIHHPPICQLLLFLQSVSATEGLVPHVCFVQNDDLQYHILTSPVPVPEGWDGMGSKDSQSPSQPHSLALLISSRLID